MELAATASGAAENCGLALGTAFKPVVGLVLSLLIIGVVAQY